jgi:PAS domain S-box-containing protein
MENITTLPAVGKLHILFLEDNEMDAELISRSMKKGGLVFSSVIASGKNEFKTALGNEVFDVILADHSIPQFSSLEALQFVKSLELDTPFVLVTGTVSEEFAVSILQEGAEDYILKNNLNRLPSAILRAIDKQKTRKEKERADEALVRSEQSYKLLFESNPIPMWMIGKPGNGFIAVNQAAIEHYGYSKEEFLMMNAADIRPEEDVALYEQKSREPHNGVSNAGIWRHRKKNGEIIYVEITSNNFMWNNEPVGLILSIDVTEKLKYEEKLKSSYEEIREQASRLQEVREEERTEMAREIHDVLGQMLTAVRFDVSLIGSMVSPGETDIKERLAGVVGSVNELIVTVREIASKLRPGILDDMGLCAALEWQSREFRKRTGIACRFLEEYSGEIDRQTATAVFRIYQEALTNIVRHAEASVVYASLKENDGFLIFSVTDNGKGFDTSTIKDKKSLGITGMNERALIARGELAINSAPGSGTTITLKVKL